MRSDEWVHILTLPGVVFSDQVEEILGVQDIPVLVQKDFLTGADLVKGSLGGRMLVYVRPEDVTEACDLVRGMFPPEAYRLPGNSDEPHVEDIDQEEGS